MGLFSSKRYYYAHAASSSLIEDPHSTLRSEILKTSRLPPGKSSIADAVKTAIFTDMYARAKAMLKYASKADGYIRGFPESNMTVLNVAPGDIDAALTRGVGAWDSIVSTHLGRGNAAFLVSMTLKEEYPNLAWPDGPPSSDWDENAATFDIPLVNPDTGTYYQATSWDFRLVSGPVLPPEDTEEDAWIDIEWEFQFSDLYAVTFNYTDNMGIEQTYDIPWFDLTEYFGNNPPALVQIKYLLGGETYYWVYVVGSDLDEVFESQIDVDIRYGQYLPVAVLMQDEVWFDENPDSQLAITTNKLLKKLATSGTDIREDFQEQEAEDNASGDAQRTNAEKWDFFVHFAVPIRTQARGGLEYLFHYFKQLEDWQEFNHQHYEDYLAAGAVSSQPINEIVIKEAGNNGYNVAYRWSYVYSETFSGAWQIEETNPLADDFGQIRDMKPGEYTSHLVQRNDEIGNEAEYREQIEDIFGPGIDIGDFDPDADEENHDYIVITRQEKEGNEYTRVIMMAPSMEYTINTSTDEGDYRFRYVQPDIWNEDAEPELEGKEFRFPIHATSLLEVSRMHREETLNEALTATVFLVEVVKVKWYQTGFFKWLIIIIAVVLVVLAIMNPAFLQAAAQLIATAIGVGASALAVWIIYSVLAFAVGIVITLASGLIGGDLGTLFAIVAMVAFTYSAMANQPGGFSWTGQETQGFAQAAAFVSNVNALVAQPLFAVLSAYNSHQLEQDIEDFTKERREKLQELKDAYDGLGEWPQGVDPWDIIVTFQNPSANETPESFIGRTTDANPGMKSLDMVLRWSDLCMLPPRPGETSIVEGVFVDLARQRGAA